MWNRGPSHVAGQQKNLLSELHWKNKKRKTMTVTFLRIVCHASSLISVKTDHNSTKQIMPHKVVIFCHRASADEWLFTAKAFQRITPEDNCVCESACECDMWEPAYSMSVCVCVVSEWVCAVLWMYSMCVRVC